ncbi:MAG: response regulator transcription factor [Burkholderiales bacterium]|nr:response regulator transcription factor [Burkholderiales bacterium]
MDQPGGARALVVDDHPLYRGALATLARTLFGEAGVAEASTAEAALAQAATLWDLKLVLLDFRLPGLNGAEAVHAFRVRHPQAVVVVVSASEDRRDGQAAMRAGASAFLHKTASLESMEQAIRAVLEGRALDPRWDGADQAAAFEGSAAELTPRQLEILALVCQGLSNKEISLRLGLALITVKMHVSAIFRALGVVNRTQAAVAARRLGLPEAPAPSR